MYNENALLAQWIAHRTSNPGVAGSSPAQGVNNLNIAFLYRKHKYNV